MPDLNNSNCVISTLKYNFQDLIKKSYPDGVDKQETRIITKQLTINYKTTTGKIIRMESYSSTPRCRLGIEDQATKTIVSKSSQYRTSMSCQPTFRECAILQPKDPSKLNQNELYEILSKDSTTETEGLEEYGSGGFFFAVSGQIVGDITRYKIIRKIGYGQFSTVWMAFDLSQGSKYCALKISKSSWNYKKVANDEIKLLNYIKDHDPESLGYNRIVTIQLSFIANSIYGSHICIAFDIMGGTLFDLIVKSSGRGLEEQGCQIIIKQILEGLVFLHDTCNILHTDLKPENIFVLPSKSTLDKMAAFVNRFNDLGVQLPKSYVTSLEWQRFIDWEGCPNHPNPSTRRSLIDRLHNRNIGLKPFYHNSLFIDPNIQVQIGDLGNACFEDQHYSSLIQTVQYRALEVIIDSNYSYPADLWSVGCIAFEMRTTDFLFDPTKARLNSPSQFHLGLIRAALGEIPKEIALSGSLSDLYFTSEGLLRHIDYEYRIPTTIEGILIKKYKWSNPDAHLFAEFLSKLLHPNPDKRLTASTALKHNWLNK